MSGRDPNERAGGDVETAQSWARLGLAITLSAIGGVGMWSAVVVLPTVQAEFETVRSLASLPYTMVMLGFAIGGVIMGRLSDRYGIALPLIAGTVALAAGYVLSALANGVWLFALAHGLLIGVGSSASFGPMAADVSRWFGRRRGMAVALSAAGNYVAGFIWPKVIEHFVNTAGWRATHVGIGLFCLATMVPLGLLLRGKPPALAAAHRRPAAAQGLGLAPGRLTLVLAVASFACCMAMAMPQVHIVAYCGDLGYGVARGVEMLSIMLGLGIVSRVASGFIADRIGGLSTLLLGSFMQGLTLILYVWFDGLTSLYLISALFGLVQGGIVPAYAIVVREYFPATEAGMRVGVVLMASLFGMALGGWASGAIFDLTGSYQAAFANGAAWNVLNVAIVVWLLLRAGRLPLRRPGYA